MRPDPKYSIALLLVLCSWHAVADDSLIPERRKPQFETEFGYAVLPYPYNLPGIGSGWALVGGATNIAGSYTDVGGYVHRGDAEGFAVGVID